MRSVAKFTKIGESIAATGDQVDLISKTIPGLYNKPTLRSIVFNTGGGGIGKIIQSTALLNSIKETYTQQYKNSDIHVITPHISVYQSIPGIKKVWRTGDSNFYSIIHDMYNSFTWLQSEPYYNQKYIKGKKHLIHAWNDDMGLDPLRCITPQIHLTQPEIQSGITIIRQHPKPVILFQITGGTVRYSKNTNGEDIAHLPHMFYRNISPTIMQDVVNELSNKYSFIQIAKRGQPLLRNVTPLVDYDIRTLFAVIKASQIIVCIDSFVQHAAAALNKKAIVLWGATRPHCLGYDLHNNIYRKACPTPLCNRPNSFLMDNGPDGNPWRCPFGAPCLDHDQQRIMDAIFEY